MMNTFVDGVTKIKVICVLYGLKSKDVDGLNLSQLNPFKIQEEHNNKLYMTSFFIETLTMINMNDTMFYVYGCDVSATFTSM